MINRNKVVDIDSVTGSPIRCVLIKPKPFAKDGFIEFYDSRFPHTRHGQFISQYYLSTFSGLGCKTGLTLDPASEDWEIDKDAMQLVLSWLKYHSFQHAQEKEENHG